MYVCKNCGYSSVKWYGKCPQCEQWGTFEERAAPTGLGKKKSSSKRVAFGNLDLVKAVDAPQVEFERISTGFSEFDRILGGGVIRGAVSLIGGDPGIGKSTLLLQILSQMSDKGFKVAYISGEESVSQVSSRLRRVYKKIPDSLYISSEVDVEVIINGLSGQELDFVVIDSIHSLSDPNTEGTYGGISQLKVVTNSLTQWAKRSNIGMFLVGQVTKEGFVAGPKNVEHIVDTVIYLEKIGDENVRLVRSVKNRFGEVGEVGFLEMTAEGLKDKLDFSTMLIAEGATNLEGSALGITMQGTRPLVVNIQTLLNDTIFAVPRHVVEGISKTKVEILSAVITKKVPKVYLDKKDLFIKATGGITLKDPGVDLAIVGAIISAALDKAFESTVFIGEVGLLGEIKSTQSYDMRYKEAKKLGFKNIYSHKNLKNISELVSRFS